MRIRRFGTPLAVAGIAVIGLTTTPIAMAEPTVTPFDTTQELVDAGGAVVTGWTVEELEPADDTIPGYHPAGQLWEADVTVEAVKGAVTPIIPNFSVRAANGDTYRVVVVLPAPEGLNPSTLQQGQSAEGELYFDVTGAEPDSVVYSAGGHDLLIWKGES